MAKDITIQEGGIDRHMSGVAKLKTALDGGGTCYWVPEDQTTLKTKNVTKNGTYSASSDDAYGYSKVTVNVRGGDGSVNSDGTPHNGSNGYSPGGAGSGVVGYGADGNEHIMGVDQNGNLVDTKMPSRISIVTDPSKTLYNDGEGIDISGIVVKAYYEDGNPYDAQGYSNGTIPFNELSFEPTAAAFDGSGGGTYTDSKITVGDAQLNGPITIAQVPKYILPDYALANQIGTVNGSPAYARVPANFSAACTDSDTVFATSETPDGTFYSRKDGVSGAIQKHTYTYKSKTVTYYVWSNLVIPVNKSALQESNTINMFAWFLVYGPDGDGHGAATCLFVVTVNWTRPGGDVLSDTFFVTVQTGSGGGGSEGGWNDIGGGSSGSGGGSF